MESFYGGKMGLRGPKGDFIKKIYFKTITTTEKDNEFDLTNNTSGEIRNLDTAISTNTPVWIGELYSFNEDGSTSPANEKYKYYLGDYTPPYISIPYASSNRWGIVKPDNSTIQIDDTSTISVPKATVSSFGLVQPDGSSITISNGIISASSSGSETPIATASTVGKVKPDNESITIDENGTIKATGASKATASDLGVVKPDNESIVIDSNGTISTPVGQDASSTDKGVVKIDDDTIKINENGQIYSAGVAVATTSEAGKVLPDDETIKIVDDTTGKISVVMAAADGEKTTGNLGLVKPDGKSILIDENGVISTEGAPKATDTENGVVKPDGTTITVDSNGTISAYLDPEHINAVRGLSLSNLEEELLIGENCITTTPVAIKYEEGIVKRTFTYFSTDINKANSFKLEKYECETIEAFNSHFPTIEVPVDATNITEAEKAGDSGIVISLMAYKENKEGNTIKYINSEGDFIPSIVYSLLYYVKDTSAELVISKMKYYKGTINDAREKITKYTAD